MIHKEKEAVNFAFINDHEQILRLTNLAISKKAGSKNVIDQMSWHLHRHLYVEEKLLFTYMDLLPNDQRKSIINKTLEEHDRLLYYFRLVKRDIDNKGRLKNFRDYLHSHLDFELDGFYETLEKELTREEKKKFLNEINKPIKLGFYPIRKLRKFHLYSK